MESPLVSVILPTRNRSTFITKAIESVWMQTYKNMELIVVNDGSTDDTANIIASLAQTNPKMVIITNATNTGIVGALNRGISIAKGKYIARLDDDDTWCDAKKIEKQVDFLENNPEYALVGGGVIRVDQNGKEIARYLLPEKDQDIRKTLLIRNAFVHTSVLFRKNVFEKVGEYDQDFLFIEDWDLWLKMGRAEKFYNFPEFFVRYLDQEYHNSHYYRNWGIRRNIKMNMALKKKYKNNYPGYVKAMLFCYLGYVYSFVPWTLKKHLL